MPKEILLYEPIYDDSAARFINSVEAAKNSEIAMRINTPGGSVYSAYGMIAKYAEHKGGKTVKVDGRAFSGGAFFCCYADSVECLDVSEFLFHRAALPAYIESDPEYFTEEVKASLNKINADLKAAMLGKVSETKFAEVTGKTLDEMFSLDNRIDIKLTSAQAKDLGLVDKVIAITPVKKAEINALCLQTGIAAVYTESETKTEDTMAIKTAAEFKAENPEAYKEILKEGAKAEADRVGSWMAFNEIDPEAVKAGISGGGTMTETQRSEFAVKAYSKQAVEAVTEDGAGATAIKTAEPKPLDAAAKKELADFNAEVDENLIKAGLKKAKTV